MGGHKSVGPELILGVDPQGNENSCLHRRRRTGAASQVGDFGLCERF